MEDDKVSLGNGAVIRTGHQSWSVPPRAHPASDEPAGHTGSPDHGSGAGSGKYCPEGTDPDNPDGNAGYCTRRESSYIDSLVF